MINHDCRNRRLIRKVAEYSLFRRAALVVVDLFEREQEIRIEMPALDHFARGFYPDAIEEIKNPADFVRINDFVAGARASAEQKNRREIGLIDFGGAAGDC